ncbi:HPr(Ser) kinase/phosphatase [Spiroplasma diminutum]|uniref:HPr kinase/phosphorylase n=1 Tax=Spiroplasma diminutum CUAS-1 TaxID=1276221 RepID=S5M165_9MOLU|nr:HPr(Ser) kinase/phosphatase [Spiroplasma diminutum]AGR41772.1 HPr kinase/phosphorylase [Spiroplasma diminutum CUAS-1]
MSKLYAKKIIEAFKLEIIAGKDKTNNLIEAYGINRAGLELTGYFEEGEKSHRIIVMSTKEYSYIMNFGEDERKIRYQKLFTRNIPMIILTDKFEDQLAIDVALATNSLLVRTNNQSTSDFTQNILEFMDDYFAPLTEVHASCVNIFGKGVLLVGESGIGKSEITLDLVKTNHLFVGDDRIVITKKSNELYGKSHEILKNLVEVRGIGIVDVSQTNGYQVILERTKIDLVIELTQFKKNGIDDSERLGNTFVTYEILGVEVPYIKIPVTSGRNIPNIIEAAVAKLKIKQSGLYKDETQILSERALNFNND